MSGIKIDIRKPVAEQSTVFETKIAGDGASEAPSQKSDIQDKIELLFSQNPAEILTNTLGQAEAWVGKVANRFKTSRQDVPQEARKVLNPLADAKLDFRTISDHSVKTLLSAVKELGNVDRPVLSYATPVQNQATRDIVKDMFNVLFKDGARSDNDKDIC